MIFLALYVYTTLIVATVSLASEQGDSIINFGECTSPSGRHSLCIHLNECGFLLKMLLQEPLPPEDRQFLSNSQCGTYKGEVLICCPTQYISLHQPKISEPSEKRGTLPEPGTCGKRVSGRVYGGNVTKIDESVWSALLIYDEGDNVLGHHCGGSLINDRYILTAAHCLLAIPETWRLTHVRLGEWDTTTSPDCEVDAQNNRDCADPHIDVRIEKAIPHEKYAVDSQNQRYDIALLRLSRSILPTDFIQPICLPVKEHLKDFTYEGIVMEIAGWGETENRTTSNKKLRTGVAGVTQKFCQQMYGQRNKDLDESQLCAGGHGVSDSCTGDSGGGLIALDKSNKAQVYFFQVGIVSYGPTPCATQGWPAVYTKVSHYIDWIQENLEP